MPSNYSGEEVFFIMQQRTRTRREREGSSPRTTSKPLEVPPPPPFFGTMLGAAFLLFAELVVHGFLSAFIGAYAGSWLASTAFPEAGPFGEILSTLLCVGILLRVGVFCSSFESPYFKRYFILDQGYEFMIEIRECVNGFLLFSSMWYLWICMRDAGRNGGLKDAFLGEKLPEAALQMFAGMMSYFNDEEYEYETNEIIMEENTLWHSWMSWRSAEEQQQIPEYSEEAREISSARFILAVGLVISSIAKMLYLTVLATYMKSVEILMKMHLNNCSTCERCEEDEEMTSESEEEDDDTDTTLTEEEESQHLDEIRKPVSPKTGPASPKSPRSTNAPRIIVELKRQGKLGKRVIKRSK